MFIWNRDILIEICHARVTEVLDRGSDYCITCEQHPGRERILVIEKDEALNPKAIDESTGKPIKLKKDAFGNIIIRATINGVRVLDRNSITRNEL